MHRSLIPVVSSTVEGVWFGEAKRILLVSYLNGKTYAYESVDKDTLDGFLAAQSKGQYLNSQIKPRFNAVLVPDHDIDDYIGSPKRSMCDLTKQHPVLTFLL